MITWNYRVFQELAGDFVIREVFYEKDQIIACTQNPVEPFGNTLEGNHSLPPPRNAWKP